MPADPETPISTSKDDIMPIWPYFNPGELHTQDLNAFQVFDQSERAKAEDRMKRDQLNRAAEQEAVRQAGMMEYNQLRAGGMSPEDAYFRTAGKINAGGGPTDYGLNLDRMGTSPKVVEKNLHIIPSPNGMVAGFNPTTGESLDLTPPGWGVKEGPKKSDMSLKNYLDEIKSIDDNYRRGSTRPGAAEAFDTRSMLVQRMHEEFPGLTAAASAAAPPAAKTKVQLANALAQQHPEWSKQQIIQAVNSTFK
jgi:hypothetical protein